MWSRNFAAQVVETGSTLKIVCNFMAVGGKTRER